MNNLKLVTQIEEVAPVDIGDPNCKMIEPYVLGEQDTLIKADNYDRFEVEEIIQHWKKMATQRFAILKNEGRLRTKLETWNTNPDEIDIIR